MKRKLPALAALVALLACALGGAALAMTGPALESEVSIRFAETIHFDRMQGEGGMDIDFGIQPLPMPNVAIQIPNPDGSHTLRVRDGRVNAGNWSVSAKWTANIVEGSDNISNAIFLYEPVCSDGLTPKLNGPTTPPYLPNLSYMGFNTVETKMVDAASGLTQGSYDMTYAPGYICLYIAAVHAVNARPNTYSTTVVWTLTSTVPTP